MQRTIAHIVADIHPALQEAATSFISDISLLALPLSLENETLRPLPPVQIEDTNASTQNSLNLLEDVLHSRISLYLLLRHDDSIFVITFVPYRAPEDQRTLYLHHRYKVVKVLGEPYFKRSLICKEIGEITDVRSWDERDRQELLNDTKENINTCSDSHEGDVSVRDVGYNKNKCRLCDRRMKNKITSEALEALETLDKAGACVQIVSSHPMLDQLPSLLTLTVSQCRPCLGP